jgi:hypothetical protein
MKRKLQTKQDENKKRNENVRTRIFQKIPSLFKQSIKSAQYLHAWSCRVAGLLRSVVVDIVVSGVRRLLMKQDRHLDQFRRGY